MHLGQIGGTIAPPQGARGRSLAKVKEVAEDNSTAGNWEGFYKRIVVRGESERRYSDEELENLLEDLSQAERDALAQKLSCLHFERAYPRVANSVLEDVFYLIQTARWHLKHDANRQGIRETLACSLHRLYSRLEEVAQVARELEERTGFRGQDWEE